MPPISRRILNWFLSVVLMAIVAGFASSRNFYLGSIQSPYFAASLAGVAIIYACIRQKIELFQIVGVAAILWGVEYTIAGTRASGIFLIVPTIAFFGLAALLLLGLRAIWTGGEEQRLLLYAFVPSLAFAASDWYASDMLAITERLHPKVYDFYLFSYDASLVVQPATKLAQLFVLHPWFRISSMIVYVGLALPIALVYGLKLKRDGRKALPVMYAFLATGPIGVLFYNLLPALGPAHVFGSAFPFHLPSYVQAARLVPDVVAYPGPRNAIPSLHMGWMLLAWWNSKGLPIFWRVVVMYFLVFTVFATLGTGEHYLVDLIVAFPFALLLQAFCRTSLPIRSNRRLVPLMVALLTIIAWMALLVFSYRLFWISPAIPWIAAILTVGGSIILHRWLTSEAVTCVVEPNAP
jgi:hypothetical protein